MALITVFSAKGAPGATTTALLLATLWPRPSLLVDADPAGGDVALRLPDAQGQALDTERGMLSLLPAARRGLVPHTVLSHAQTVLGGQQVVVGLRGPEQARAADTLWPVLAESFASVPGVDVIVDAGQVASTDKHLALVDRAAVAVAVYRPRISSVMTMRRRLTALSDLLSTSPATTGVLAIATGKEAHDVESAAATLRADLPWLRDFGVLADDPAAARMFDGLPVGRPERTMLARTGRRLVDTLVAELGQDATAAGVAVDPGMAGPAGEHLEAEASPGQASAAAYDPFAVPAREPEPGASTRRRGRQRLGRGSR